MQNTQSRGSTQLRSAIAARNAARNRLKKACTSLERGQVIAENARTEHVRHVKAGDDAQAAHATAVEKWIVSGADGIAPTTIVDERSAKALRAAEESLAIAQRALSTLQQQRASAQAELAITEKCARDVVTNAMIDEAITLSQQILESEAATAELRIKLMGITEQRVFNEKTLLGGPTGTQLPGVVVSSLLPTRAMPNSVAIVARYRDELWGSERFRVTQSIEKTAARIDALIEGSDFESSDDEGPLAA